MDVIIGTWDDILIRSAELRGKKLKVEILGDATDKRVKAPAQNMSLIEALADFVGSVDGGSENYSDNTSEKFTIDLLVKHQDGIR